MVRQFLGLLLVAVLVRYQEGAGKGRGKKGNRQSDEGASGSGRSDPSGPTFGTGTITSGDHVEPSNVGSGSTMLMMDQDEIENYAKRVGESCSVENLREKQNTFPLNPFVVGPFQISFFDGNVIGNTRYHITTEGENVLLRITGNLGLSVKIYAQTARRSDLAPLGTVFLRLKRNTAMVVDTLFDASMSKDASMEDLLLDKAGFDIVILPQPKPYELLIWSGVQEKAKEELLRQLHATLGLALWAVWKEIDRIAKERSARGDEFGLIPVQISSSYRLVPSE